MEKDLAFWFHHQQSDRQPPDLSSLWAPFEPGRQNSVPAYMSPCPNGVSTDGSLSAFPLSGQPHSKPSQPKEPNGWFYCLPRFRQGFTPVPNSILEEKIPTGNYENCAEAVTRNPGSGCAQKRFLVFDQSGDKTTLIFSSGIGTPGQCPNSWTPKPLGAYAFNREEPGNKRDVVRHSGPNLTDEYYENHVDDGGSEMREDTEEINALLFSDDDSDYSEDDEVTSTGHSPSTMTASDQADKQEYFEFSEEEEVASSAEPIKRQKLLDGDYDVPSPVDTEPIKRQKLLDGDYDVPSLVDTATSVKSNRCSEHADDAESSCGDEKNEKLGAFNSLLDEKRSRKEKIRETVSILQTIIPGGKGKDASMVLDEAIHYLRSLKRKAEALGLDTL